VESILVRYNLTIILSVEDIDVVGNTMSNKSSPGLIGSTYNKEATFDVIVGPIGVPDEFDNCISTYPSTSAFAAGNK